MKRFHLYRNEKNRFQLAEICCGEPERVDPARGETSESKSLRVMLRSIRNIDAKLQWDGFAIDFRPPKRGVHRNCSALNPDEQSAVRKFLASGSDKTEN